uniref:Envoplakin a n=1 Tax=Neolamprologus brichardi TaxID=32507 RepID=A0A3Q4G4T2_NEOBR
MFKKKETTKDTKNGTLKVSGKISKSQATDLALLITQMQKDADLVEKNVLRAEELLAVDFENDKKELPYQHQKEISDELGEAEGLLKKLFIDVDKAKNLKHPQATDIESDVLHLHERWLKDCTVYRDIYEQLDDVSRMPLIDWGPVLSEKQKLVDVEQFGPSMADLEKQIAAHNIVHKEIEAYNTQLCLASAGNKDNSKWRRHYLNSLYEYMHGCKKELNFLAEEQNKIKKQDWSDHMLDPPDVRRQYENFKNNSLLSHEAEVNKLQDEGERLVEMKHPASDTIQAQRDDVRNEWQKFLNLCICQETHLDSVEDFKRYQYDSEQLSESLTKLNSTLDPKTLSKKSKTEKLLQLEAEEKDVQKCEQLLADLRKRSTTIAPLKLRRTTPSRAITVESLCDWETGTDSLERGDKFTLKSNSDVENWNVISTDGKTKKFPGVCFQIPPPDSEAIDKVDLLGQELADIKKRRAALLNHLKRCPFPPSAPVSSAPMDPKATALSQQLDKLDNDLAKAEESMLSRLRAPLSRSDPAGDLAKRMKEQEQTAQTLQALQQQQQAAQAGMQPLLAKDPNGTSSGLPLKLSAASNKSDNLAALADLYNKKANASLNLEKQIKKVDGLVSGFEKRLSEDGPIPDGPKAIETRAEEIQQKSVAAAQNDMKKLSKDLETTEQLCSSLQQGYQEYCPDIQRQKTEVKQLQARYTNVANQLKERESTLLETTGKNQEFQSTCKSLNSFLDNLPTNKISPNDDLSQIAAKKSSQEEYEANVDTYNSTLEDAGATVPKKPRMPTLSELCLLQEKSLVNRYAETKAENTQRQKQMVQAVAQQQVRSERSAFELDGLVKELEEEKERRTHAETNLRTFKDRFLSLKSRRGVERVEEKEVLKYYRDPKVESDLRDLQQTLHEEILKRTTIQTEVEVTNKKVTTLAETVKSAPPKLVTREVTEFEKDPQLDTEAAKLRDQIMKMREEIRMRDGEHIQMKTEVTILQQKRPTIKERVVKKEVVKVEKDPEMLRAVRTFETVISDESKRTKLLHDDIFQTRSQINALERLIPNIEPKIITKEVKKIEQDQDLINESQNIRTSLEEERIGNNSLVNELTVLHNRYREVYEWKPRVEVKEIVNEIYRIDPNTEVEIMRLRKEIQDCSKQRSDLERGLTKVTTELNIIQSEKPRIETKEVFQEVVKEERSPENEKEIQRLNDQVHNLHSNYDSFQDQLRMLRQERDEWKAEKSKVETQFVTRDLIKYEPDPLQEKEFDRLRNNVREEAQIRRTIEEMVFDLKNKYIQLERQKPEEKVVVQEVVRLQKDPRQMVEHERLSRNLDEEVTNRRQFELQLQQLRTKVEEKERILRESVERQKRIQAESEVREIKLRISQLENAPPPVEENIVVEEVLKVERDPKLERLSSSLRSDMDNETSDILRLQREIRNINIKLEILQKEKSSERTVYKEVVRVEKDQAVEAERDRLREQVSQSKFARQDLEDELRRFNDKIHFLMNSKSATSREETTLIMNRDALQREKEDLTRELRSLDGKRHDISLSFQQQSRLMSERTQMSRQRSIKMESDVMRLERDILDEKDNIHQRDSIIRELIQNLQKEESAETRTKETNVSTKITILDPVTGKDMSPYDAYLQGLIDRPQYIHLQELECDWEEITSLGPDGEISVLQDRKSGKQYSIKDALKEGRLTEYDLKQYKQGKIPISEFALLVAGDNKKQSQFNSITPKSTTSLNSAPFNPSAAKETYPVAGIIDTDTDTCYTIRNATVSKLIDSTTAQRLLEAQASTGGIIDISNKGRYTVHKAANRALIEDSQIQRLLNAQKAFTGVEDPVTKEHLSVGKAVQKGWMPKDTAIRFMEAQHLTGGLVDPDTGHRVSILDAVGSRMIDNTIMRDLETESAYIKDIIDPITKEKINYKQALNRCRKDPNTGLPMLPASSKGSGYSPVYNSTRYARF